MHAFIRFHESPERPPHQHAGTGAVIVRPNAAVCHPFRRHAGMPAVAVPSLPTAFRFRNLRPTSG